MEELTAAVLSKMFGTMISPDAHVRVPWGWYPLVKAMMTKLSDLPSDVRVFMIVQGVAIDERGMLSVSIAAATDHVSSEGWAMVERIVSDARAEAAWTCVSDRKEGWLVSPPRGRPRPLCIACQQKVGLTVECHSA